jgi:hypothetical protein
MIPSAVLRLERIILDAHKIFGYAPMAIKYQPLFNLVVVRITVASGFITTPVPYGENS